jgi:hemerythrin superfamily protein
MKNAITLLKKDHKSVRKLFKKIQKARDPGDAMLRSDLFHQIREELTLHTQVEEELVYPVLADIRTPESDDYHESARHDHQEVKILLDEMNHLDVSSDSFMADMDRVIEIVEYHIREEEDEIFPLMKQYVARTDLLAIGEQIEERKAAHA